MKLLKRLKKGLAFLIAVVLLLSVFPIPPKTVRAAEVVTIPDDALRAAICEKFNVSDEEITKEMLEKLTSLIVTYAAVSDLTGIENCTSLQYLSFTQKSNTELDLTPLENLSALTELHMSNGNVSSIPRIPNLSELYLSGCKIDDTASIFNLTGLTKLSCYQTEIAEISDCSGMSSLQSLTVDYSASLTNISGISGCNSLSSLSLTGCYNLTDISPLRGLGLTRLYLRRVKITSENQTSYMETISSLSELEYLELDKIGLEDEHVSMFDNLNSLEWLVVSENSLTSAEFLVSHKDTLTGVALSDNPISDSTPLGELTKLERIEISETQITDFSFLSKLPDLTPRGLMAREWTTESPAQPGLSITDKYPLDTDVYIIQNPFKDVNGNLIAPRESEKYSYNEETGEITVPTSNVPSVGSTYIRFPYTYTTAKGEELVARPFIALRLNKQFEVITQPEDVTIMEGGSATLKVEIFGPNTIRSDKWQWYKDGDIVTGKTLTNTDYTSSLTISNATMEDAGSYYVVATDINGNSVTSDSAVVTVTTTAIPLKITTQPQNVSITEGGSATLEVVASGSGTLSYQWYKDDDAINGATSSSLTISNAVLNDAGSYTVEVTDINGSITSNPAVVTVNKKAPAEPETTTSAEPETTKPAEPEPTNPVVPAEPETTMSAEPETTTSAEPEPTKPVNPTDPVEPTAAPSAEYDDVEEEETGAAAAAVKTSDTSPVVPVMVLLLVSGMVLCITVLDKKNDYMKK